jgi:hypothetical protein
LCLAEDWKREIADEDDDEVVDEVGHH